MLNHNYDYKSNLETSLRINWRIEDVIGGRTFDYGKPFLPDALAGVAEISQPCQPTALSTSFATSPTSFSPCATSSRRAWIRKSSSPPFNAGR